MMLSSLSRDFAREISGHDFSDAPWRLDRAGHQNLLDHPDRRHKTPLTQEETDRVRLNVVWVVAQVLRHSVDPDLPLHEFAKACGVPRKLNYRKDGRRNPLIPNGLRWENFGETVLPPGRSAPAAADTKLMAAAEVLRDLKTPYVWSGGTIDGPTLGLSDSDGSAALDANATKRGFDSGSLVQYLLHRAYGIEVGRTTMGQYQMGAEVTAGEILPGDLIFPRTTTTPPENGHVYLGDGLIANIGDLGDVLTLTPIAEHPLEPGQALTVDKLPSWVEARRIIR